MKGFGFCCNIKKTVPSQFCPANCLFIMQSNSPNTLHLG